MTEPTARQQPPRRTQRERKEATVSKLVDATLAAIYEVGYGRASVQEICRRAGVSHGGLFRHFGTRLDLIVKVAEELGKRLIEQFWEQVGRLSEQDTELIVVLAAIRGCARSQLNLVWFELLLAARTDQELRGRLVPIIQSYAMDLYAAALKVPAIASFPVDRRLAMVFSGLHMFNGEAMIDAVYPRLDLDDQRLEMLSDFLVSTVE